MGIVIKILEEIFASKQWICVCKYYSCHARDLSTNQNSGYNWLPWQRPSTAGFRGRNQFNFTVVMTTGIIEAKKGLSFLSLSVSFSPLSLASLSLSLSLALSRSLSLSLSLALSRSLSLSRSPLHSIHPLSTPFTLYPLLSHSPTPYRPFASSTENRTRASRFGGGVSTTALSNGRCRG